MPAEDDTTAAYDELTEHVHRITTLGDAAGILRWDQQVMMPEGGTPARSAQLSAVSSVHHDLMTDDRLSDLIATLEGAEISTDEAAVVREIGREHRRAASVPRGLVERITETVSDAHPAWQTAKETDDFATFEPYLEEIVSLRREYAAEIDPDSDPYAVLFAEYEPYIDLDTAEGILTELRERLVPLIDAIQSNGTPITTDAFAGTYPVETQEALSRSVLDVLGYDWERGRMDTAPHPFSSGTQFDARVTTRFDETDLVNAISSTIHEFGHAHYTLGLPTDAYGSPLGKSRDLTVHESQSRFWENHVGRSEAFWSYLLPTVIDHFPELEGTDPRAAYETANQVYPDNLIRVEADELTYHLHIVIRFEIERDLISGAIDVEDVPTVWNDKYESYLGVRPDTDAVGCLQDIHWSNGSFGYFPTYSLGSVLAAQLADAMSAAVGPLEDRVAAGEFGELSEWLREHVHRHGRRYTTPELIEEATGEPYSAQSFLRYVETKYGSLYGV